MKNNVNTVCQIVFDKVAKYFQQDGFQIKVIENISIKFEKNRTYALMGASGVGKSTLLYLLAGLDKPTSGSIYYNETDLNKLNEQAKIRYLRYNIGLIFQTPSLISELSVLENIMIKGLISGDAKSVCEIKAHDLLKKVGLANKAKSLPNCLSGGEQQRVAIARALFNKPDFLIADEPTAHLDSKNKARILELLLEYQKDYNFGLIVASHDLTVAQSMQEILELIDGKTISVLPQNVRPQNLSIS